jgi:hypothetical protein
MNISLRKEGLHVGGWEREGKSCHFHFFPNSVHKKISV